MQHYITNSPIDPNGCHQNESSISVKINLFAEVIYPYAQNKHCLQAKTVQNSCNLLVDFDVRVTTGDTPSLPGEALLWIIDSLYDPKAMV